MHGEDNAQRATMAEILRWQAFALRPAPPQHDRGNLCREFGNYAGLFGCGLWYSHGF
jgi:hypothetical protein